MIEQRDAERKAVTVQARRSFSNVIKAALSSLEKNSALASMRS
jgi:hypothetical protein